MPEVWYVLYRHGIAGFVEVKSGKHTKRISVKDGACIFAESDDPNDGLLPYLLRTKRITREQLTTLVNSSAENDREWGEMLIEDETLSPLELYQVHRSRMEQIVWSVFWLKEGHVSVTAVPDQASRVTIHIPLRQVIVQGVRRAPRAKELVARLGTKTTVYEPEYTLAD